MPLLVFVFSIIISKRGMAYLKNIIGYLGKYSLEIYVANVLSWTVGSFLPSYLYAVWTDILLTALLSIILHFINHYSSIVIKKYAY